MTAMRQYALLVQVAELQFGPLQNGALSVDCSVTWRNLSASGPGINTNYLMDLAPEWRDPGGPTFQQALQVSGHWRPNRFGTYQSCGAKYCCDDIIVW